MKTVLSIIVFVAMGALGGVLWTRKYAQASKLGAIISGIAGSLLFSWLVSLMGLGAGFTALSLWGIVFGILGAVVLPLIFCGVTNRKDKTA